MKNLILIITVFYSYNTYSRCILEGRKHTEPVTGTSTIDGVLSRYHKKIYDFKKKFNLKFNESIYFESIESFIFNKIKSNYINNPDKMLSFDYLDNLGVVQSLNLALGKSSVVNSEKIISCLNNLEIYSWNFTENNSYSLVSRSEIKKEILSCLNGSINSIVENVFPSHPIDFVKSIKNIKDVKEILEIYSKLSNNKFDFNSFLVAHKEFKL